MYLTKNPMHVIFAITILLLGCSSPQQAKVESIDAEKLKALNGPDVILLDVRTPNEYASGRIKGSVLINFRDSDFSTQISTLDSSKPVIVYCAAGGRSTNATKILQEAGFTTIYNYKGGFSDWKNRGESIEK